jgi:hypothetical protein
MKIEPQGDYVLVRRKKNKKGENYDESLGLYFPYQDSTPDTFIVLDGGNTEVAKGDIAIVRQGYLHPTLVEDRYLIREKYLIGFITDEKEKTPDPVDQEVQSA